MADIVTQDAKLSIGLTLERDGEERTRTFSVDNPLVDADGTQFRAKLQALQNFLLGDGNTLIQPTGWRDADATENEWTTVGVNFETSAGATTKWDTRLSRNMRIEPATLSYSDISTDLSAGTTLSVYVAGASYYDVEVNRMVNGDGILAIDWWQNADSVEAMLARDSAGNTLTGELIFSVPEQGVYQSDSVTLEVVT